MSSLSQQFNTLRARVVGSSADSRRLAHMIDLLRHLVWRDFSLRYKHSALGMLWSLMLPLAQLLVMVFLFQAVVPLDIEAYPAFVFCALLPWGWFSSCLSSAGGLFIYNRDLVRHPNFSPASLGLVNTLSNLITFLAALPILVVVLLAYNRPLGLALLALPLLLLIQGVFTAGLNLILATLNVFYRDVQHIVSVALMLLFYLTPVFYRPHAVAAKYQIIYQINPMAVLVQSYRAVFFEGVFPSLWSVLFISAVSVCVYALGYVVYRHWQHEIIDTV